MTSTGKKILLGAAGTVGAGLLSWRALFPWIGYDLQAMGRYKRLLSALENGIKSGRLLIDIFETTAEKYPKKAFVIFEDRVYSYEFMNEQANRVANIAAKWGLKVGECVAIMMENQPAFIWTFLGLQKLGIATALLNFNIKGQPLVHMLRTCEARFLICSSAENLVHTVEDVRNDILDIPVYVQGHSSHRHFESWDSLMHTTLPVPICPTIRQDVGHDTTSCYIFTSGTTGLPKPAIVTQLKCIGFTSFLQLFGFTSGDIVYTTIPLYHSAAFGVGLLNVIGQGATMVLKRKFSAHQFFEDVRKYDVTVIQYIGELCRYLLAVPESPLDGKNKVRLAVGNGLRADVWNKFKERFRIPEIGEFFAATEGTSAFVNLCNRTGSVGRYSPLMRMLDPNPNMLVKCDLDTGEVVRDRNGLCIPAKAGEPGLLLGPIPLIDQGLRFYKGGKEINEKKMLRNVLKEGDIFFNFGDILMRDSDYFLFFVDRIGDTFRWKGENVATYEVSNVLTKLDVILDANVYGVEIPGSEGRAGMAAIHLVNDMTVTPQILRDIYQHANGDLPSYARPLFLRFPRKPVMTSTMKQQKTQYRKEGFYPQDVDDPLFYYDEQKKSYSPLTMETYSQFLAKSRL